MTTTVTTSEQRRHRGAPGGLLTRAAITQIACLTVASLCTVIATGLVYRAKVQRAGRGGNVNRVLNLNTIQGADDLLPVLSGVVDDEGDRRFTAERIARCVMGAGSRNLDHVGDLARLRVSASDAKRFRRLSARAGSGSEVSLLSPTELAQLKTRVAVRGLRDFRSHLFWWLAYFVLAFHAAGLLSWLILRKVDGVLLGIVHLLAGLGFAVMASVRDPIRDTLVFVPFAQGAIVGLAAFGATLAVDFRRAWLRQLTFLPLVGALALSALLILFGSGPGSSQAKVNLGPVQPVEGIRLLLILFLAGYFARRWQQLRSLLLGEMKFFR